jgi:hypothetical protein
MTWTTVDSATGDLMVGGRRVFPLGLSDPPSYRACADRLVAGKGEVAGPPVADRQRGHPVGHPSRGTESRGSDVTEGGRVLTTDAHDAQFARRRNGGGLA